MLILASSSPRRKELLTLVTDEPFQIEVSAVDERAVTAENAVELVKKLAMAKAKAVADRFWSDTVIGCDTVVELNGEVLGKPADQQEATRMIKALSGAEHLVHTGVCLCRQDKCDVFAVTTRVEFLDWRDDEIRRYVLTSEPYDKAGGYAIQGYAARFVAKIDGCYFNVMGLPVSAVYHHLRDF